MNEHPPLLTRQANRNGWLVYSVLSTFLLILSVTVNVILVVALISTVVEQPQKYQEHFVTGDSSADDKVAVIYLTGVISYQMDGHVSQEGMVGDIKGQLQQALNDEDVQAIILRINSPGGEVVASDAIYRALAEARGQKPIVASIETVGASGAYYAALGCSHIMANDLTVTGSIGVIMNTFSFGDLMGKVGIKAHTFKSGNFKDILNPAREPTEAEQEIVRDMIMEVYDKFVKIVAEERKMTVADLQSKNLVDGRIFSGTNASNLGLVDSLGDFDDAVDTAMSLAGIGDARVVRYQVPFSLAQIFGMRAPAKTAQIQVNLGPQPPSLEAGKMYFLPAYMFQ
jgi:protease-4